VTGELLDIKRGSNGRVAGPNGRGSNRRLAGPKGEEVTEELSDLGERK
jgi:hypothetical protein